MRVLGRGGVFEDSRFRRKIRGIVIFPDVVSYVLDGIIGSSDGICPHIRDKPHGAFLPYLYPLIELLGDAHGFFCGKAKPS